MTSFSLQYVPRGTQNILETQHYIFCNFERDISFHVLTVTILMKIITFDSSLPYFAVARSYPTSCTVLSESVLSNKYNLYINFIIISDKINTNIVGLNSFNLNYFMALATLAQVGIGQSIR